MSWKDFLKEKIADSAGLMLRRITWQKLPQTLTEWQSVNVSYSQLAEDLLVNIALAQFHLSKPAYYVDVGACDPVYLSNTLLLHQDGWLGINIDPNPHNIARFQNQRPNDINLNLAIAEAEGKAEFIIYESKTTGRLSVNAGIGSTSILGEQPQATIQVRTMPLKLILEKYSPTECQFGFLNVDCEGGDLAVLRSNDWVHFRPWIVAVEDHCVLPGSEISQFMLEKGYRFFAQAFITKIFVDGDLNS